jgi:hypothetical protein
LRWEIVADRQSLMPGRLVTELCRGLRVHTVIDLLSTWDVPRRDLSWRPIDAYRTAERLCQLSWLTSGYEQRHEDFRII